MSLVNKMLRDLDARRAGDGDRAALPAAVTPLAAHWEPGLGAPRLWLAAVLVTALLGLTVWYVAQSRNPAAPATFPATAEPAAPTTPLLPATTATPAPTAAAEPVNAQASAPLSRARLPSLRMSEELSAAPAAAPSRKPVTTVPNLPERPIAIDLQPRAPAKASPIPAEVRIDKQVRLPSPAERAESEYRRGILAQRLGNAEEAAGSYRAALDDYPEHAAARQTLAALLIDTKRFDEAEELLRKGMELAPARLASTLSLARLKVERNQAPAALELLLKNAASGERSAEYQGFVGALLNRAERPAEAVERYQAATRLAPGEGRWWAGLGIALDAAGKGSEAREAYQKARALPGLPADLAQHIDQRLR